MNVRCLFVLEGRKALRSPQIKYRDSARVKNAISYCEIELQESSFFMVIIQQTYPVRPLSQQCSSSSVCLCSG